MKRLLAICPVIEDATSFWRGVLPVSQARKKDLEINFERKHVGWTEIAECDAVFMQRPSIKAHLTIIEMAKYLSKPVWIDYDDDLSCVPMSNKTFYTYMHPDNLNSFKAIIGLADFISVTGSFLKERIGRFSRVPIDIIPNAWPDKSIPWEDKPYKRHNAILWRGGDSHNEDLEEHLDQIAEIAAQNKDLKWIFFGAPSYKILKAIPKENLELPPPMPILNYYKNLKRVEAQACIVPLVNSNFNKSKSNIGWLEATYAGCATIGPNFSSWNDKGIINYDVDSKSLPQTFSKHFDSFEERYLESQKIIKEKYLLSEVNKKRTAILERMGL